MLIKFLLVCTNNYYTPDERSRAALALNLPEKIVGETDYRLEDWADWRRLYGVFVDKSCTVFDLKDRLRKEFGLPTEGTSLYWHYKELPEEAFLLEIPDCEVEEGSILTVVAAAKP
jgi:hypothetical protein